MQPYAKKSRSTSSEPAVSALAPQQGTSEDFPLSATPFHFFSHLLTYRVLVLLTGLVPRVLRPRPSLGTTPAMEPAAEPMAEPIERDETPSGGTARRAMEGYALHDDELHRLQRAGAAAVTGGGASADAGAGGRPKHEPTLTLAGLSDQLHALARSHEASLGRLDGLAEAQAVLLREVRSAAAGVHELQVQQRSLAERLELPTGAVLAAAGSNAELSVAAAQEAAASSSEQLREQTAELWMLQQALRAELQRRPDAETVDALLSRKLDRAGGEVAAHATSHMPHARTHMPHAFNDACTRTHTQHAGMAYQHQARLRALEDSRGAIEERLTAVEAAAEAMHRELHARRRSVRGSKA